MDAALSELARGLRGRVFARASDEPDATGRCPEPATCVSLMPRLRP
jgi:hypothetical protein